MRRSLPLIAIAVTACSHPPPADLIERGQKAARKGKARAACDAFGQALAVKKLEPEQRLRAIRGRVSCAHRLGYLSGIRNRAAARARRHPDDAEAHYILAIAATLRSSGRLQEAISHLQAARRADPAEAEFPHRQGLIELAGERFGAAIKSFRRASRLRKCWAPPRIAAARAFTELGDFGQARRELAKLPDCSPPVASVRRARSVVTDIARYADPMPPKAAPTLRRAMRLFEREMTAAAAAVLRRAIKAHPKVSAFALLLGLAQVKLSNYGDALAQLRRAAKLNPQDGAPPLHLGEVLTELGREKEALPHFRLACRLNPVSARAYAGFGRALRALGRVGEALPLLKRAAALNGKSSLALIELARSLSASGRYQKAIEAMERASKLEPRNSSLLVELAELILVRYRKAKNEGEAERLAAQARAVLRRALKRNPNDLRAKRALRKLQGED